MVQVTVLMSGSLAAIATFLSNAVGLVHGSWKNLAVVGVGMMVICLGLAGLLWPRTLSWRWRVAGGGLTMLTLVVMVFLLSGAKTLAGAKDNPRANHPGLHRDTRRDVSYPTQHPIEVGSGPLAGAFVGPHDGYALSRAGDVVNFDPDHPEEGAQKVLGTPADVRGVDLAGGDALLARSLSNGIVDAYRLTSIGPTRIATLQPGNHGGCLAVQDPEVWMCNKDASKVDVFNTVTRQFSKLAVPGVPTSILIVGSDVWVSVQARRQSYVVDFNFTDLTQLRRFPVRTTPGTLAFDGVHLWVALSNRTFISLDVSTGEQIGASVLDDASAFAMAGNSLCALNVRTEQVSCYDPNTDRRIGGPCKLPAPPAAKMMLYRSGELWVAERTTGAMFPVMVPSGHSC